MPTQVWILTGDKEETAVNISYSAGHFFPGINEARITKQENMFQCTEEIERQLNRIQEAKSLDSESEFGVVIDGQSLNYALEVRHLRKISHYIYFLGFYLLER